MKASSPTRRHDYPSDDKLDFARLKGGDDGAIGPLMRRHTRSLRRHLVQIVKNPTDAADLAEEAFVRVSQHRADFNYSVCFSTWLYSIATHLAIDLLRKRAREPNFISITEVEDAQIMDPSRNPAEATELRERDAKIQEALTSLPQKLKVPLALFHFERWSYSKIASHLGCTEKAVEMRLANARGRLRNWLREAPLMREAVFGLYGRQGMVSFCGRIPEGLKPAGRIHNQTRNS